MVEKKEEKGFVEKELLLKEVELKLNQKNPEEFEITYPVINKWTTETYLISPYQDVQNLLEHGYIQQIST